jgi:hypothetical protein
LTRHVDVEEDEVVLLLLQVSARGGFTGGAIARVATATDKLLRLASKPSLIMYNQDLRHSEGPLALPTTGACSDRLAA